jgi:NNP family nitrate/nitrite transporter-like MFS transporter
MLGMATIGFAVNFWAWALISPLGPLFRQNGMLGTLSESDVALLVAVPVIVGSLGRILIGALTDKFGGRVMFPIVSGVTILPILFIAFVALDSFALLLVGGFFLGIAGTTFADRRTVRERLVPPGAPRPRRGRLRRRHGRDGDQRADHREAVRQPGAPGRRSWSPRPHSHVRRRRLAGPARRPGRTAPTTSLVKRLAANARLPITWQASALYAVAFGGYVAFSVYLPAYLKTAYALAPADAANRMAGFVVVAVIMRPVGGWLSDRFGPIPVLAAGYAVVVAGAGVAATNPLRSTSARRRSSRWRRRSARAAGPRSR